MKKRFLKENLRYLSMILTSISFFVYLIYFISILYPKLNDNSEETKDLFIPVIIYGFAIITMGYISYLRGRKMPGFWSIFLGTLFFLFYQILY